MLGSFSDLVLSWKASSPRHCTSYTLDCHACICLLFWRISWWSEQFKSQEQNAEGTLGCYADKFPESAAEILSLLDYVAGYGRVMGEKLRSIGATSLTRELRLHSKKICKLLRFLIKVASESDERLDPGGWLLLERFHQSLHKALELVEPAVLQQLQDVRGLPEMELEFSEKLAVTSPSELYNRMLDFVHGIHLGLGLAEKKE